MQLILAQLEDLSDILAIYESAIQLLAKQGSTQWQDGYGPQKEELIQHIQQRELYLLVEENHIAALATLQTGIDPCYTAIEGKWRGNQPYLSIHRLAVSPKYSHKGYAKKLLQALILQGKLMGYCDFRIDTHALNMGMKKVILASGFTYCGVVTFPIPDGERLAYQFYDGLD